MTTIHEVPATGYDAEQTRARYPEAQGYVDQDGVRVFWERYGEGEPAILFLPTWEIGYSRVWKCQIPYFSRRCRVVTFDPGATGAQTARGTYAPTTDTGMPRTQSRCWTPPVWSVRRRCPGAGAPRNSSSPPSIPSG